MNAIQLSNLRYARPARVIAFCSCLLAALVVGATPAAAQLSRVGPTKSVVPGALLFGDVAHDPRNDVYLSVMAWGSVWAAFADANGAPITSFAIPSPAGAVPRVAYGPDLNGGKGGFLVTFHQLDGNTNFVHSAVVSYPGGVVSLDGGQGATVSAWALSAPQGGGASIAYSPDAKKFLVAWVGEGWSIKARLISGITGVPEGDVITVVGPIGTQQPAAAWNPHTKEFGVGFAGFGAYMGLVRVNTAGAVVATSGPFGQSTGTFNTALAVNSAGRYVLGWSAPGGAFSLELDGNGTPLANFPTLISGRLGTPTSFAFALNPASGTILAVSEGVSSREVPGVEMNSAGVPLGTAIDLTDGAGLTGAGGSYAPRVTARSTGKQWSISYSRYTTGYEMANQVVATGSTDAGGGLPAPASLSVQPLNVSPSSGYVEGNPITFTASATGGTGPLTYQFVRWNGSAWSVVQAYSTSNTFTMVPAAGTYAVQVWVRNAGSTASYDAWTGTQPFVVSPPRATLTGFTVNRTFPSPLNVPITWTASAVGGAVEYKFLYTFNGGATWVVGQNYGPSNSFTWYPPLGSNNAVQVWVRRVGSGTEFEDWRSTGLFLIRSTGAVMDSVTPRQGGPTAPTTTLSWSAVGFGGSGPLEYKFFLYNQGTGAWSVLQDWGTSAQAYWTPGMTGLFLVQTWVRTIGSGVNYEDWRNSDYFAVTNSTALTLTADRSLTSLRHGDLVTWTAQVVGPGLWEYQFITFNGSTWTRQLPAYKADNTFSWFVSAGTRAVQVWVRPAGSTAAWERWAASGVFVVNP